MQINNNTVYHSNPVKGSWPIVPKKESNGEFYLRMLNKVEAEIHSLENNMKILKDKVENANTENVLMEAVADIFRGRDDIVLLQPNGPDGIVAFIAGLEDYGLDMERLEDYDFEIVITDRKKSHDKNEDDSSADNTSKNPTICPCIMCSDECEGMDFCTKYKKYEQYIADKYSKVDNHKNTNKPPKMNATKKESSPSTSTLEDRVSSTVKTILNSPYLSYIEEYLNDMFPDSPPTREEMRNLYKEWAKKCSLGKYCVDKTCGDCVLGPYD